METSHDGPHSKSSLQWASTKKCNGSTTGDVRMLQDGLLLPCEKKRTACGIGDTFFGIGCHKFLTNGRIL
jgi:hypothetical protein